MDRSILVNLVVFLATILVISHVSRSPRCLSISIYCRLVSVASVMLSTHHRTTVTAALPARLRTHGSSQTVHTTVLHAAGLLLLLAYLA